MIGANKESHQKQFDELDEDSSSRVSQNEFLVFIDQQNKALKGKFFARRYKGWCIINMDAYERKMTSWG